MYKHRMDLQTQINNQKVLQSELSQLKPYSKVYRKQDNSDIFFASSLEKEMKVCKETLDDLVKQYNDLEKPTAEK